MKYFSTPSFSKLVLCVFGLVLCAAVGTAAYTEPTGAPTAFNTQPPVTIGATDQVKAGGLSVNAFTARDNAQLQQRATFKGLVRGGTPSDTHTTVQFGGISGGTTYGVDVAVSGTLRASDELHAENLSHGTSGKKALCADGNGKIVICPAAVVNGACGDTEIYDGQTYSLCNGGTPINVSQGQCTWTWTCEGSGGGTSASCSAQHYHWEENPPAAPGEPETSLGTWATC